MKPTVHIYATVRKPELLQAALLVFRTLRVGFPSATVCVWGNALAPAAAAVLAQAAQAVGGAFVNLPASSHDRWIEGLLARSTEPFWICDTDMIFWDKVEGWRGKLFAGRYEPEFDEEWTRTRHVARLHTCLMWIDPVAVRSAMRTWMARYPLPWRNSAQFPFVAQHFIPAGRTTLFYDSCAGLHQALGGTRFTDRQNAAFDHLHFATYADLIGPHLKGIAGGIQERFEAIYRDPGLARGIQVEQAKYYLKRKPRKSHV
jgi:hypothetical protein